MAKIARLQTVLPITAIIVVIAALIFSVINYIANAQGKSSTANINATYSYYIDRTQQLVVDQVYSRQDFTPVNGNEIPYQLAAQNYWIKIKVQNLSVDDIRLVLHANNAMLASLDIYKVLPDGNNKFFSLEDSTDINLRVFPHTYLNIDSTSIQTYLIKAATSGPPDIPLTLQTIEEFQLKVQLTKFIYGGFIAVVLLMALYNLVFYFAVKNKIYLFYIGYLLSSFIVLASLNGFGYLLFTSEIQQVVNSLSIIFHYFLIIFLLLFTLYFLRYDSDNDRWFKVSKNIVWLLAALSIASAILDQIAQAKIFFTIMPVFIVLAILLVSRKIVHEYSWAKYYFLSWVPFLIGASIQPMVLLNFIEHSFFTRNAFLFAVLFEIIFLSFALAERLRKTERDRLDSICYHTDNHIPRSINLENTLNRYPNRDNEQIHAIFISPEQIEAVSGYANKTLNLELQTRLYQALNTLVCHNDAVYTITENNEKVCFIEPYYYGLLFDTSYGQSIEDFVESVQLKVSQVYQIKDLKLPFSAIVGFCQNTKDTNTNEVLNYARQAIKQAKEKGLKTQSYEHETARKHDYLLNLAADMSKAIDNDEFEIFHQPQIDLKTLRVCSSECLIRWYYGGEGFISPAVFIPLAEDIGLIHQLTRWVIRQGLKQQKDIRNSGYQNHSISINISGKDLQFKDLSKYVEGCLNEFDIPAEKLILEITESAKIHDNQQAIDMIEELIKLGITISIDDFGTGYSSLAYMEKIPCQEIKIDRQFVENIAANEKQKIICETTIKMAKGLNQEIVAEGINSTSDEEILRDFGCDIGQGFYYAKPMPLEHYLVWLEKQVNGRLPDGVKL